MQFVQSNWEALVLILTSAVALASAIAALTPTPKDDGIVKKLYKLVDTFALNVGKAKEK
jgi:hypothetical protein